ncbi:UDP-glucose 4-epimerase [Mucilaginibacter yixingensis]|uniref:UDP-glucose 4-epimerase n=1 Tax=Mucilaginibacter yixingensis TaxID=1295612 RepID=A0A2T5J9E1_9SPHI|nr:UDP-glucose 4-epimerase GalE [Mucilaginibacter yixingensis]PTQ96634.1 UDP-glucose 4-epimerase [Mucilaginibacter yixingensis]
MKKKILVTGGMGYIGSHTVVELINAGYHPVIVDNLSNSDKKVLTQIKQITGISPEFYEIDLCDKVALNIFMEHQQDIAGVIHFAAFKAVGESVAQPLKYYDNNFGSLINVLRCFEERKVAFVFSSSCTVYGQPDVLPVTEEAPIKKAESPYGNTKQVAEEILQDVAKAADNYQIVSLRYFNPVGAHASALIGELPRGIPQNLVPFITQSAIGKRGPLTVFGSDYDTADGTCIRDFIHVVDLAKAHVAALQYLENNKAVKYDVFNVGTGKGYTVLEAINAFDKANGQSLAYQLGERRAGDIEKVWGEVSKSASVLNWKASLEIDEMMRSAWAWEQHLQSAE